MKAERSRLIPRKYTENQKLLIAAVLSYKPVAVWIVVVGSVATHCTFLTDACFTD